MMCLFGFYIWETVVMKIKLIAQASPYRPATGDWVQDSQGKLLGLSHVSGGLALKPVTLQTYLTQHVPRALSCRNTLCCQVGSD